MKMWASGFVVHDLQALFFRHPAVRCWVLPGGTLKVESPVLRLQRVLQGLSFRVLGLGSLWERGGITGATYVLALTAGDPHQVRQPWGHGQAPLPRRAGTVAGIPQDREQVTPRPAAAYTWLSLAELEHGMEEGAVAMDPGEWRGVQQVLARAGLDG